MTKLFSIDDFALESIVEDYDHDAAEVVADGTEVTNLIESAEDQTSQVGDLQEAVDILDQQDNVSNEALEQFAILRDNVYRNLGMSPTVHPSYIRTATEDTSARMALKYALEQEKNFLQRAWDAVWKFLVDMWNKAKNFFMKLFGMSRRVDKGLDATEELAKKFNDSTDDYFKKSREAWEKSVQDRKNRYDEQAKKHREEHADQVKRDIAESALKREEELAASKEAEEKKLKELREKTENDQKQAFIKKQKDSILYTIPRYGVRLIIHRDLVDKMPNKIKNAVSSESSASVGVDIKYLSRDWTRDGKESDYITQTEFKEIITALSDYNIPPPKGEKYGNKDVVYDLRENKLNVVIIFALKDAGESVEEEYEYMKNYANFVITYSSYLQKLNQVYASSNTDSIHEYNPEGENFKKYKKLAEALSTESDSKQLTPERFKNEYMVNLNAAVTNGKTVVEESVRFINHVKSMLG